MTGVDELVGAVDVACDGVGCVLESFITIGIGFTTGTFAHGFTNGV